MTRSKGKRRSPSSLVIALVAAVLVFRLKWPVLRVLGVAAVLGLVAGLIGLG
ncbi:hypothetical protein [Lentzea sp. NPDC004782]|uniref:hypothetical protein n=1 Tax=Lentzea sp. NPDC004782 TaxID=3154458 RepID=UPI0033B363E5